MSVSISQVAASPSSPHPSNSAHSQLSDVSPWLLKWAHLLKNNPTVLDVACGSGRHMQFLNQLGCKVTGVDKDELSLQSAARFGKVVHADIENSAWPESISKKFQVVIVFNYLHRPLMPQIQECVAEGGLLIYETFAIGNEIFGRPKSPEFLLQANELLTYFNLLSPIAYESGQLNKPDRIVQRAVFTRSYHPDTKSVPKIPLFSLESPSY
jgi:SAM-dependent methyltransferase